MSNGKEKKLVKNLKKGDVHSFDEIFKAFNKRIYFFSFSYLKNKEEAEGIVQEVFLSLWKNRTKLKVKSDFQAYLFTITFNTIKKRFRALEREKKHLGAYSLSVHIRDDNTNPEKEYAHLNQLLEKSLEQLPPRQKEIFLLSKNEGLTAEEIASKLEISKRTVENHLFRAKTFLKGSLLDEGLLTVLFFCLFIQ